MLARFPDDQLPSNIVQSWIAAVNAADANCAIQLTIPSIRVIGPRGVAEGHDALRQWVTHAGASFTTLARYARGPAVVLAQRAEWRDTITHQITGSAGVATRFIVQGALISEIQRYDDVTIALADAGLTETDRSVDATSPGI